MLDHEIITAVKEGQFHIYPVHTIETGIEILTGLSAGKKDPEGNYPPESVHGRVLEKLKEYHCLISRPAIEQK